MKDRPVNRIPADGSAAPPAAWALGRAAVVIWLGAGLASGLAAPVPAPPETAKPLTDLTGKAPPGWLVRPKAGEDPTKPVPAALADTVIGGVSRNALQLPVVFPGRSEYYTPATGSWTGWQYLELELLLPEGLPRSAVIYIFTRDRDFLWRQVRRRLPRERGVPVTIRVPIAGQLARENWQAKGHQRPWHWQTPDQLLEYGCSFELDTGKTDAFEGTIQLLEVRLAQPGFPNDFPKVTRFGFSPQVPEVGECCEFSFALEEWFRDPFDPKSVSVTGSVSTPSDSVHTVRGFYCEDFLFNKMEPDKTKTLLPYGAPLFKIRYAPREPGPHEIAIRITVEGKTLSLPPVSFTAQPPPPTFRGNIRRDPENTDFLQWEDGTHFWALGLNVRSPYDLRYLKVAPYSKWENEGLPLYERLFATYEKAGIQVVEVWMSSWWLALEWINDAPGFHGVGVFNQYRAWMLDYILDLAEKHGIYLILVFNNHGKFGALNDTEWARNPFNVKNGGYLKSCEEYFADERAKRDFKKLCDYAVARWGYSHHIMMWKLFTEIDLTGTSYDFYTRSVVADWHREMGAYLKSIDLNKHLVTTHWMLGYHRINDGIALLPELDVLTTDAYYQRNGTRRLLEMLRGGAAFAKEKKKPLLITEYGGSPHADSMGNLIKQAHLGVWTGFFHEAPAAPMFWWFALVDEKDMYSVYTALDRYSRDEDRRGLTSSVSELSDPALVINEMRDDNRLYVWGFDSAYYLSDVENQSPRRHADFVLTRPPLAPGAYALEFWDVARGEPISRQELTVASGAAEIRLAIPAFQRDFALKITKRSPE